MYWTSRTTPHIYRIKMDGSESVPSLFAEYRNYNSSITALAIGFDKLGGNLYWAVDDSGAGEYVNHKHRNLGRLWGLYTVGFYFSKRQMT